MPDRRLPYKEYRPATVSHGRRASSSPAGRRRPQLESLEDRLLLTYSFAAVPYQAVDLTTLDPSCVTTVIQTGDIVAAPVDLGANTFNFYGTQYTGSASLFASSKGLLPFGAANASFFNGPLANTPDQPAIAPWWTDWHSTGSGPLVLAELDAADNLLVIQWNQAQHFLGNGTATFQAVLQLNTGDTPGDITFNYLNTDTGDPYANGAAGTIGIKDGGNPAPNPVQVSFNATNPLVGSGQAIQFSWVNPNPPPVISGFDQASAAEGGGPLPLTVNGANFLNTSVVQVNGVAVPTTFVSATQLAATLPASLLAEEGSLVVTVFNPGPPVQTSNALPVAVTDAPLALQVAPLTGTEGQAPGNVLVGTLSDPGSDGTAADYAGTVTWDDGGGQSHTSPVTFQAAGANTFNVYATDDTVLAEGGSYAFTVAVRDQGGGTVSAASAITVADSIPEVTASQGQNPFLPRRVTVTATFSDQTCEHHTATVDWGDGSVSTIDLGTSAGGSFALRHWYTPEFAHSHRDGVNLEVTVQDDLGTVSDIEVLPIYFGHHHRHHHQHGELPPG